MKVERLGQSNFNSLSLNKSLIRALLEAGYKTPTPIQMQAIPKVIEGHDLLAIAQTGTGKTAAFSLPILNHINSSQSETKNRSPRALILAPTRELAIQIAESIRLYGAYIGFKQVAIFGGVGQTPQVAALRKGVDIIVATPGRLLDLVNQGVCKLDRIELFVLDEADRMLDMGFVHDVKKIVAQLPRKRQTLFFSATMPKTVSSLAANLLVNPVNVSVEQQSTTVERIAQSVIFVPQNQKIAQLTDLLNGETVRSAIVFTRTKHRANRLALALNKAGISTEAIHGNKSQSARQRALGAFKKGQIKALVATDIAARGIDVDAVSHVINFELPNVPEDYVHRIGRTARAGASGIAISLCAPDERAYLKSIEKLIRLSIEVETGIHFSAESLAASPQNDERPPRPQNKRGRRPPGGGQKKSRSGTGQGNAVETSEGGKLSQGRNNPRKHAANRQNSPRANAPNKRPFGNRNRTKPGKPA
jgi:ATP-dependent RNA helicase RhlE